MWNNIYSKMQQWLAIAKEWFAIAKNWVIQRKEWVIIGATGVLAVALIVGVIFVIVDKTSEDDPHRETTTGSWQEATDQTYDTEEGTAPQSGAEDTTAPSATDETTAPEETTESTGTESTKPTEKDPVQDSNDSSGTGFTDQAPPTTPVTPSTPTTPETPEQTTPPPTETMAPEKPVEEYTYQEYMALESSEKTKFFHKFPSLGAFNRWYNAAKKAYDEEKFVIGDSNIDLGELLDP